MSESMATYHRIAFAIGEVCLRYSTIEQEISLISITAAGNMISPMTDVAMELLGITLASQDIRQRCATAKGIIHMLDDAKLYARAETLLNRIDNELRAERNRYVHDIWIVDPKQIRRLKEGVHISRPQARQTTLTLHREQVYPDVESVEAFSNVLLRAYDELCDLHSLLAAWPEVRHLL